MIRRTSYVRLHEMDLSTGAREYEDIEEEDVVAEREYQTMSLKEKVIYQVKNW